MLGYAGLYAAAFYGWTKKWSYLLFLGAFGFIALTIAQAVAAVGTIVCSGEGQKVVTCTKEFSMTEDTPYDIAPPASMTTPMKAPLPTTPMPVNATPKGSPAKRPMTRSVTRLIKQETKTWDHLGDL